MSRRRRLGSEELLPAFRQGAGFDQGGRVLPGDVVETAGGDAGLFGGVVGDVGQVSEGALALAQQPIFALRVVGDKRHREQQSTEGDASYHSDQGAGGKRSGSLPRDERGGCHEDDVGGDKRKFRQGRGIVGRVQHREVSVRANGVRLKMKCGRRRIDLELRVGRGEGGDSLPAMEFENFVSVERKDASGKTVQLVVHAHDPRMVLELIPAAGGTDQEGNGVIKRVAVPNSWAGNYSQYARVIARAQAFFRASQEAPTDKAATRRLQH